MKILIKGTDKQISKTYDEIFRICDKYSTFWKAETETEYKTNEGYIIKIESVPPDAIMEISEISNIEIL